MGKKKRFYAFMAGAALCALSSGCLYQSWDGNAFKDAAIGLFNDAVEFVGSCALTGDLWLTGTREMGSDNYNGSYTAIYERYDGEEYLFGGTSLERESDVMRVGYTLEIKSGSASLCRIGGEEEETIAAVSGEGECEFSLKAGDHFIVLKGENFTGSLTLTVRT